MKYVLVSIAVLVVGFAVFHPFDYGSTTEYSEMPTHYKGKVNAPDFPKGLDWLNTDHPLSIKDLRGKIVLLDFWTYCCINCMHEIPELKKLEKNYANELVVIGVHSAKFTTEKGTKNIREAIFRYGVEHPIVNDNNFDIWDSYAVNAWPTFVLIDPDGKVVAMHAGEGVYESFDDDIAQMIKEFDGKIDATPVHWALEKNKSPESLLSFPGKVTVDKSGKKLFISDSNHHRIIAISLPDKTITDVIGNGRQGLKDGSFAEAEFNRPQGMGSDGDALYVADTENHAIRKIDFKSRTVTTIAGDGRKARQHNLSGIGTSVSLNSPWDLVVHGDRLYIAMAGTHQLWTLDLASREVKPYAGSGRENIVDGKLLDAALAQPSGITTDGKELYFADSEVSAVRSADFASDGSVSTIVGEGLFEYGDIDGVGSTVRLQHPLGLVYHDGSLYVADTYNNKIKKIDPKIRRSETFIGTGISGMKDGRANSAELNEPGGITYTNGKLYIADTNNDLIRVYDFSTGLVSTMQFANPDKLLATEHQRKGSFKGAIIRYSIQEVTAGEGSIDATVEIPTGYKLNSIAPFYIACSSSNNDVVNPDGFEKTFEHPDFPVQVPARFTRGKAEVNLDLVVYYCEEEKESLCLIKKLRVVVPVVVGEKNSANTVLAIRVSGDQLIRSK